MVNSDKRLAWRLQKLNWIPIAAMAGVLGLGVLLGGFSLEPVAFGVTSGLALELALIAYLYHFARKDAADPKLVFALGAIAQLLMVATLMGPLSYVAAATSWPLQDKTLLAIDRALGMDPEVIARFVDAHPAVASFLKTTYGFIKWFMLGVPIILATTLRLVRLQVFVGATSVALAVTIAISALTPAIGTYYGLNVSPAEFTALDTSMYLAQWRDILALRAGSLRHLELFNLAGVVSFPSFHAASGVLYMWALWPVRRIGLLALGLNAMMIAATPVIGAHYMIDVIGGVVLAAASIIAARCCHGLIARKRAGDEKLQPQTQISWQPN
jgi:membrane-associated phospholipid phosphatase